MDLQEENQMKKSVEESDKNTALMRKNFMDVMEERRKEIIKKAEDNPAPSMDKMVDLLKEHQRKVNMYKGSDEDDLRELSREQVLKRINPLYKPKTKSIEQRNVWIPVVSFLIRNREAIVTGGLTVICAAFFYYRYIHLGVALPEADLIVDLE